jgi:D-glycero-D-manno-heptose 1,7-bisphosphate phosphatase
MGVRAVFLDRDGTVNTEENFLADPELIRLEPAAPAGLRALRQAGFLLVVVSNQSGVARGLFDERTVRRLNDALEAALEREGVKVARYYFCPHHPAGTVEKYAVDCPCRKPAPGMLLEAAGELDIDLAASYTVGDRARDLEAGRRAGTRTVLVTTGYGVHAEDEVLEMRLADYVARDLEDAAAWIVKDSRGEEAAGVDD